MTTPTLSSDALSVTLKPSADPVMVTEYMPGGAGAQIINTGAKGTVYAGTSSTIQASNGVPIPAGSSVQWTAPGQLWLVLGSDATAPVTVAVSDRINNWASAEVIGTLNISGDVGISGPVEISSMPDVTFAAGSSVDIAAGTVDIGTVGSIIESSSVFQAANLGTYDLSTTSPIIDIADYQEIIISTPTNLGNPALQTELIFTIDQLVTNAPATSPYVDADTICLTPKNNITSVQFAVAGNYLYLQRNIITWPAGRTITVYGTNRNPAARPNVAGYSSLGTYLSTGSQTFAADGAYPLIATLNALSQGQMFQGPAFLCVQFQSTLSGYLAWEIAGTLCKSPIADTKQGFTDSFTNTVVQTLTAIPADLTDITFVSATAATGAIELLLVPNY